MTARAIDAAAVTQMVATSAGTTMFTIGSVAD
jgi:hypothetical protein